MEPSVAILKQLWLNKLWSGDILAGSLAVKVNELTRISTCLLKVDGEILAGSLGAKVIDPGMSPFQQMQILEILYTESRDTDSRVQWFLKKKNLKLLGQKSIFLSDWNMKKNMEIRPEN